LQLVVGRLVYAVVHVVVLATSQAPSNYSFKADGFAAA
jgi:hypothetical protein